MKAMCKAVSLAADDQGVMDFFKEQYATAIQVARVAAQNTLVGEKSKRFSLTMSILVLEEALSAQRCANGQSTTLELAALLSWLQRSGENEIYKQCFVWGRGG